MPAFRGTIRVQPGARRDAVGGASRSRGGRPDQLASLVVRVRARPVEGAATSAAERAVAHALGVRAHQVRVRGSSSREKLVEVSDPPADIAEKWARLLARGD